MTPPVSIVLRTTTRFVVPIMLLFSLFLLLRGHNAPGGGFGGALVAVAAYALYAIGSGWRQAHVALRCAPESVGAAGLAIMLVSAALALLAGRPAFAALRQDARVPGLADLDLATPALFDVGVYLAVFGSMITVVLALIHRARVMTE
ncbi:MAG: Na(+)/H(+) antiporter subunit B [Planctomycetota bacterium]|nr:Na(+)/H(+) antiporter subunit B [Planctomycetota bacterium]